MKAAILLLALFGGVASAAPPLNADCDHVASFARAIAKVKATGIPESQLENYISQPIAQTFPITLIRHQIYAGNLTPADAYTNYYSQCLVVGYNYLLQSWQDADELEHLRVENRQLKSTLSLREDQITQLDHAYQRMQSQVLAPTPPPPVTKSYGAPIASVHN